MSARNNRVCEVCFGIYLERIHETNWKKFMDIYRTAAVVRHSVMRQDI